MPNWNDLSSGIQKRISIGNKKLEDVASKLKKDFCGIDEIIDQVISKISLWYLFPELIERPTIVTLWGMTGVGKTDLVRKLSNYLELSKKFVEIEMNSERIVDIKDKLSNSLIEYDEPGILLIDEIQKFKTVNERGEDIMLKGHTDMWTILSDGVFPEPPDRWRTVQQVFRNCAAEVLQQNNRKKKNKEDEEDEDEYLDGDDVIINSICNSIHDIRRSSSDFNIYQSTSMKKDLGLKMSVDEIAMMGAEERFSLVRQIVDSKKPLPKQSYRKLLIFISGNLDEAFHQSMEVEDCDTDADVAHHITKQIKISHIKEALTRRFRPEQISRFGNNYVIYPSLDSKSFYQIIRNSLKRKSDGIRKGFGLTVKFTENLVEVIYKNGVFPTQGTRPVFTTIGSVLGTSCPTAITCAAINNLNKITIDYDWDKRRILFTHGKKTLDTIDYVGDLELIRNENNEKLNLKRAISVHEAGHAIVYSVMTGLAPEQMLSMSINRGGFTTCRVTGGSPKGIMQNIVISMGGTVAEEIIFGKFMSGGGNREDVYSASMHAGDLVRRSGLMKKFPSVVLRSDENECMDWNMEESSKKICIVMGVARDICRKIIQQYMEELISISKEMFENGKITPEQMVEICSPKIDIKIDGEAEVAGDFNRIFMEFEKGFSPSEEDNEYSVDFFEEMCSHDIFKIDD